MTRTIPALRSWYPVVHLGLYQVTWFAALMGGAALSFIPGLLAAALMLAVHLAVTTPRAVVVARLVQATVLGVAVDAALALSGAVAFSGCTCVTPPLWMVVLWPCFASLFDDLLRWLPGRPLLAVGLGALGGPAAYYGGAALGALAFPGGLAFGLSAIAIAWALATWVLMLIWRGAAPRPPQTAEVA